MAIGRCNARWLCALGVLLSIFAGPWAAESRSPKIPLISEIQIEGNQRVESDAIRLHITQRAGEPLNPDAVSDDIKSIYQMGFFSNVIADTRKQNGKEILVYKVIERPQVTDVKITGMKGLAPTDDKIVAAMKMHPGRSWIRRASRETEKAIKDAYAGQRLFRH